MMFFLSRHFSSLSDDVPYLVAQCGGVVLGGDVIVGDVDAAGLVHLDHVVTKLEVVLIIPEVTLLGPTEETN